MRLSPKSIFLGIVAFGLPFAVTIGWTAGGTPATEPPPSAPVTAGASRIGAAPARVPSPVATVDDWVPEGRRSAPGDAPVSRRRTGATGQPRPSDPVTGATKPAPTVPVDPPPTPSPSEPAHPPTDPPNSPAPDAT